LEGRILELENLIKSAKIIEKGKKDQIQIGSIVTLKSKNKKEKFQIVGAPEADPSKGKISIESPLGKTLLGKKKGQIFEIETEEGKIKYKILKIE